jgi:Holliday junction DNA helicase RuvA
VQLTLAALGYEALEINRALRAISLQSQDLGEDGDAWLRESLRYLSRDAA